jgi:hypothetical protein
MLLSAVMCAKPLRHQHQVMIPLLINQSNISLDFSLQLSKCLADSDLVVIGLTGIGSIRKISVLDIVICTVLDEL